MLTESVQLALIAFASSVVIGTVVSWVGYRLSIGTRKTEAQVLADQTRLAARVDAEKSDQDELSRVRQEYLTEITALRTEMRELRSRLDQKDREIDALQDENRELRASVRVLKDRLIRYEKENES